MLTSNLFNVLWLGAMAGTIALLVAALVVGLKDKPVKWLVTGAITFFIAGLAVAAVYVYRPTSNVEAAHRDVFGAMPGDVIGMQQLPGVDRESLDEERLPVVVDTGPIFYEPPPLNNGEYVYEPEEDVAPEETEVILESESEPVGYIISAPTQAQRNETLTVVFQGAPNTQYYLRIVSAAGNVLTADGLGNGTTNAEGVVSWTWLVGGRTGAGVQPVTITGGGKTIHHEITIVVD